MLAHKAALLTGETPRCQLERRALDLGDRGRAQALYRELGASARKVLVITEGVLPYLTTDAAAALAQDLHAVPQIAFWAMEYRYGSYRSMSSLRMTFALRDAPLRLTVDDWLAFAHRFGWRTRLDVNAFDEGDRVGRPAPVPATMRFAVQMLPESWRTFLRRRGGCALLERMDEMP
jgi:O-methyltransferase involved in polyketide biosynthesis